MTKWLHSEQTTITEGSQPELRVRRDWRSPVADVDFRDAREGQAELSQIRGTGGVVIVGETQRAGGPVTRLTAREREVLSLMAEGHSNSSIAETLALDGPVLGEVMVEPDQAIGPRVTSRLGANGAMVSSPLEDLFPFLERDELRANMLVPLLDN